MFRRIKDWIEDHIERHLSLTTRQRLADICIGINGICTLADTDSEWGWIRAKWESHFSI